MIHMIISNSYEVLMCVSFCMCKCVCVCVCMITLIIEPIYLILWTNQEAAISILILQIKKKQKTEAQILVMSVYLEMVTKPSKTSLSPESFCDIWPIILRLFLQIDVLRNLL